MTDAQYLNRALWYAAQFGGYATGVPVRPVTKVIGGVDVQMIGTGDDVSYVRKFKTWDKLKALNDLAKHLGFFEKDNGQHKPSFIGLAVDPKVASMLVNPDEYTPPVDE